MNNIIDYNNIMNFQSLIVRKPPPGCGRAVFSLVSLYVCKNPRFIPILPSSQR